MLKHFSNFLFIFWILNSSFLLAQAEKVDSLEAELKSITQDSERLQIYLQLAELYHDHLPSERGMLQIIEGIELARRSNDDFAMAKLLRYRGQIYTALHPFSYQQAIGYIREALDLHLNLKQNNKESLAQVKEMSRAYNNIGYMYWQWGKLYNSLPYYDSAIQIGTVIWSTDSLDNNFSRLMGMAHNSKGAVLWGMGNYSEAIAFYIKSIDFFERSGSQNMISLVNSNIGLVYDSWGQKEEALIYFRRALQIGRQSENPSAIGYAMSNMGRYMETSGQYDSALYYYEKSTEIYTADNNHGGIGLNLNRMGSIYISKGENDKAILVFNNALTSAEQFGANYWVAVADQNIAKAYMHKMDWSRAIDFAQKSNVLAEREGYKEILTDNYFIISSVYEKLNDHQQALINFQKHTAIKDSIFSEEKFKQITLMKEQFEAERRENENEILRKDHLLQEQKLKRSQAEKFSLIIILLILIASAVYFFISKAKIKKINHELSNINLEIVRQKEKLFEQTEELQKSNEIKNLMFSIVSHDLRGPIARVGQMISMLNSDILLEKDFSKMLPLVASNISDINNLTDNLLYWARNQMEGIKVSPRLFDMHELLNDKLPLFEKSATDKGIILTNELSPESKVYADPYMVELVIRNLVTNAIKFSSRGDRIVISSNTSNGFTTVKVEDSGLGIPPEDIHRIFDDLKFTTPGTNNERGVGLGLKISQQFVELNQGKIWVESVYRNGSSFYFTLPNAEISS